MNNTCFVMWLMIHRFLWIIFFFRWSLFWKDEKTSSFLFQMLNTQRFPQTLRHSGSLPLSAVPQDPSVQKLVLNLLLRIVSIPFTLKCVSVCLSPFVCVSVCVSVCLTIFYVCNCGCVAGVIERRSALPFVEDERWMSRRRRKTNRFEIRQEICSFLLVSPL